ncbi:MAG TPA: lysylphosphatidylglycerol synthase transmembrane domain-containing protein [Gaiellaceae bacterium]|nr:lysylphosphatidylglycerol synthase transmembrane domain-containing protein [Gaiellaceae bacterium]
MIGVGIAVVAATFAFVLPRIANYGAVWSVVKKLSWLQIAALVGATLLNLVTFAPPWMVALPGLGFRRAFVLTQASTASTYLAPGGAAVGVGLAYAILRGWGFGGGSVGLATALTGIWNQLVLLSFPAVALALLTLKQEHNALLQSVAVIGLAVFVVAIAAFTGALATPKLAHFIGRETIRLVNWSLRIVRRGPVGWTADSFVRFRNQAVRLLRHRWIALTLTTLAGQLTVFVLFLVSLRVLGVSAGEVGAVEAFAAWSLTRLLGSLPITPGGLGVVEVGLTTALVGFGGENAEVVAAVLVYRFLNIVPTLVLGLIAGALWRRLTPPRAQPT